jgi:hypothetical protein
MEDINQYLKEKEKIVLDSDEKVLWKKFELKRKKLKKFSILTNKRWIEKSTVSYDAFVYVITLVNMKNGIFYLPLENIKIIFTQKLFKEQHFIGFILNEYIEEWRDEFLLALGVDVDPDEFIELLELLTNLRPIERKEDLTDYRLYFLKK